MLRSLLTRLRALFTKSSPPRWRSAIPTGRPGLWASDHLAESQRFTGWHYVAVHAKAKQAAAAAVEVFTVERGATERTSAPRCKSHDRETPVGYRPVPEEHRLLGLLRRPNGGQSGASLRYQIAQQLDLTGSALVAKVRNRAGLPVELRLLPTALVRPLPATRDLPRGGWRVEPSAGFDNQSFDAQLHAHGALAGVILDVADVITLRWPHPLARQAGVGPVAAGAIWSDAAAQLDESRWAHLRNGITPSLAISPGPDHAPDAAEIERVLAAIEQKFAGPANVGKALILPPGAQATPLATSPRDMDYLAAFTQLRDAVLALHGTPGVAAGITDGGSYAAFYAALQQFVTLTVQPMLDLVAEELTAQLASEFGPGLHIWLSAARVDDPAVLERRLTTDIHARAITKNELRAIRGLPPHPDGDVWVEGQGAASEQTANGEDDDGGGPGWRGKSKACIAEVTAR